MHNITYLCVIRFAVSDRFLSPVWKQERSDNFELFSVEVHWLRTKFDKTELECERLRTTPRLKKIIVRLAFINIQ